MLGEVRLIAPDLFCDMRELNLLVQALRQPPHLSPERPHPTSTEILGRVGEAANTTQSLHWKINGEYFLATCIFNGIGLERFRAMQNGRSWTLGKTRLS